MTPKEDLLTHVNTSFLTSGSYKGGGGSRGSQLQLAGHQAPYVQLSSNFITSSNDKLPKEGQSSQASASALPVHFCLTPDTSLVRRAINTIQHHPMSNQRAKAGTRQRTYPEPDVLLHLCILFAKKLQLLCSESGALGHHLCHAGYTKPCSSLKLGTLDLLSCPASPFDTNGHIHVMNLTPLSCQALLT
jgi:hypothetical protein